MFHSALPTVGAVVSTQSSPKFKFKNHNEKYKQEIKLIVLVSVKLCTIVSSAYNSSICDVVYSHEEVLARTPTKGSQQVFSSVSSFCGASRLDLPPLCLWNVGKECRLEWDNPFPRLQRYCYTQNTGYYRRSTRRCSLSSNSRYL